MNTINPRGGKCDLQWDLYPKGWWKGALIRFLPIESVFLPFAFFIFTARGSIGVWLLKGLSCSSYHVKYFQRTDQRSVVHPLNFRSRVPMTARWFLWLKAHTMADTAIQKPRRGWISIARGKNRSETICLQPWVQATAPKNPEEMDAEYNKIRIRRGVVKERWLGVYHLKLNFRLFPFSFSLFLLPSAFSRLPFPWFTYNVYTSQIPLTAAD